MRIAVLYDCLYPWTTGGAEKLFRGYAEEWARNGHEVTYLTRVQWDEDAPPVVPGVAVDPVAGRVELYDGTGRRRLGPALGFAVAAGRRLLASRRAYDVVYVASVPSLNLLAARAALLFSPATVISDWLEVWRPEQWIEYSGPVMGRVALALQWIGIKLSDRATCYSRRHAERLRRSGFRGRLFVSPGLLPEGRPDKEPALEKPEHEYVLFAGRHIGDKRVDLLIGAIAALRQRGRDVRAVILGDGPMAAAHRALAADLGVDDLCSFPGFVDESTLENLTRGASVLVNPSVREGYGLVIVEAAAVGVPSVAVEAPDNAAAELIHDGVNGFTAVGPDPTAVADAIARVLDAGAPLRRTTFDWYATEARAGTVEATARQLLEVLL